MAVYIIIGLLTVILIAYGAALVYDTDKKIKTDDSNAPVAYIIGMITNFFDTLGIGSFAPTTAALKFTKAIDERLMPGTLNVSMTMPVIVEAIIFIKAIEVDIFTLVSLIAAAVVGAYLGAGIMAKLPKKKVKIIMGFALLAIAFTLISGQMGWIAGLGTGTAIALTGTKLIIGIVIFFVLGALMSAGVGLYAPAMATVYLLGMSPAVAFPIMMGACAFLMPVGSYKFIKENAYAPKVSLFIALGGIIGVIFATNVVTSLPLQALTWLVIIVVTITGIIMAYEGVKMKSDNE